MKAGVDDTRPDAEAVQIALLRRASRARRASLALGLSESVCSLSRRAIQEREPGLSAQGVRLRFVELHYGRALAAAVREALARRAP